MAIHELLLHRVAGLAAVRRGNFDALDLLDLAATACLGACAIVNPRAEDAIDGAGLNRTRDKACQLCGARGAAMQMQHLNRARLILLPITAGS